MPKIFLVGTGGMLPLKSRWLTSCYIEHNGKAVLIDCGEGTQIALNEFGCKISRIDLILVTHRHADHVSGLPGFLLSLGNTSRTKPLDIYVPEGDKVIIQNLLCICENLPYEIHIRELSVKKECSFSAENIDPMLQIRSLPLKHSTACLGYSLLFGKKPVFLPIKAKELNVPVRMWKMLHSGNSVTLDDGTTINADDVTENSRNPVKITYITDTLPFDKISEFASEADLFICEGMYGELDKKESMNQKGHMLMQDACRLAKSASARELWLTHYSPALKNPQEYQSILNDIFENTIISADGQQKEIL